jgi:hypothetical protein
MQIQGISGSPVGTSMNQLVQVVEWMIMVVIAVEGLPSDVLTVHHPLRHQRPARSQFINCYVWQLGAWRP